MLTMYFRNHFLARLVVRFSGGDLGVELCIAP